MELFEEIRRARRDDPDVSVREVGSPVRDTHRRTVRDALVSAVPPARKAVAARASPVLDEWKPLIDRWMADDRDAPAKSGTRLGGCGLAWSRSTTRRLASRRCAVVAKARRDWPAALVTVMVPQ